MSYVAAKCTQCGGDIEVDDTKEAGICIHCGTAFVTQSAINNYNTYITNHITKNIYGKEKTEIEEYLANGETFLKLKDWDAAAKAFKQAAEIAPNNYLCWLGLVKAASRNFTRLNDLAHIDYHRKALAVASPEEKQVINHVCGRYIDLSKEHKARVDKFNKHFMTKILILFLVMTFGFLFAVCGLFFGIFIHWGFAFLGIFGVVCFVTGVIFLVFLNKKLKEINKAADLDK